jgi:hypothetical protein
VIHRVGFVPVPVLHTGFLHFPVVDDVLVLLAGRGVRMANDFGRLVWQTPI